jgi:hypothetical protein
MSSGSGELLLGLICRLRNKQSTRADIANTANTENILMAALAPSESCVELSSVDMDELVLVEPLNDTVGASGTVVSGV